MSTLTRPSAVGSPFSCFLLRPASTRKPSRACAFARNQKSVFSSNLSSLRFPSFQSLKNLRTSLFSRAASSSFATSTLLPMSAFGVVGILHLPGVDLRGLADGGPRLGGSRGRRRPPGPFRVLLDCECTLAVPDQLLPGVIDEAVRRRIDVEKESVLLKEPLHLAHRPRDEVVEALAFLLLVVVAP